MTIKEINYQQCLLKQFNDRFKIGDIVNYNMDDCYCKFSIKSEAVMHYGIAMVLFNEMHGFNPIEFIKELTTLKT